jgi:NAD(P)-dependent dehydrogenase (short-subunit alcohol dehydrogenase family)
MDLQLKGKTALVTGASKGIGLGVAEILAQEGCNVHLAARSESGLEDARKKIAATGVKVTCHPLDLGVSENVTRLAREAGDVDILINNAGAIPQGTITDLDEKTWRQGWELKLFGYINLTREIYRRMSERRDGVIVNVIGGAGERPSAGYIAGSIANSGLITMSRALGAESPKYGVRVVGLNPGSTATERGVDIWKTRAQKELGDADRWPELTKGFPFGRAATVEEVANVIVFLASPKSSYVSGTVISVDGGSAWRK